MSNTEAAIVSPKGDGMPDEEVVRRVRAGETALFEILMRRYNQRLYSMARAILGDDNEAEDVMLDAYDNAYTHLDQFAERAKFSTWLTKIAVHEALARVRRRRRFVNIDSIPEDEYKVETLMSTERDPEQQVLARELNVVLESAVDALPEIYRSVFMLREIEGMSVAETAECLGISGENVKTRLHRARALLYKELYPYTGATTAEAFKFYLLRCDRMVRTVLDLIGSQHP